MIDNEARNELASSIQESIEEVLFRFTPKYLKDYFVEFPPSKKECDVIRENKKSDVVEALSETISMQNMMKVLIGTALDVMYPIAVKAKE